jgi:transcriptional antiterminator NusG
VKYLILKSITKVLLVFLGEIKGEPVPLRLSEVNRMLGKVDELAVNTDTVLFLNLGETIKVLMVL